MGGDEDNRRFTMIGQQVTPEFDPIHSRHDDIQYQAIRITKMVRVQELLGRSKYLYCVPERPK
jgi:hypothetical protein